MIRKTVFWAHLVSGVLTAVVILTMSFTGVVLTYERQILHWLEQADYVPEDAQQGRLPLEQLARIAERADAAFVSARVSEDPGAPVVFSAGRRGPSLALNPYTGEAMSVGSPAVESFFRAMTGFHRWFNLEGDARGPARAITGASNLIFLFLILSGLYLWLPRLWKWAAFKSRLLFNRRPPTGKARDYNWHHVIGIWTALPLAVVVATGAVFSYGWASDLVYILAGDTPPAARGGGPGPGGPDDPGTDATRNDAGSAPPPRQWQPLDDLLAQAGSHIEGWRSMTVTLPEEDAERVEVDVDRGNGAQPQLRHTLSLDRNSGEVLTHQSFDDQPPGRRARTFVRFLHTGEVYGLAGQTIAGLVSLTSLLMVWTGLALAYRRLIRPLLGRRHAAR